MFFYEIIKLLISNIHVYNAYIKNMEKKERKKFKFTRQAKSLFPPVCNEESIVLIELSAQKVLKYSNSSKSTFSA